MQVISIENIQTSVMKTISQNNKKIYTFRIFTQLYINLKKNKGLCD